MTWTHLLGTETIVRVETADPLRLYRFAITRLTWIRRGHRDDCIVEFEVTWRWLFVQVEQM